MKSPKQRPNGSDGKAFRRVLIKKVLFGVGALGIADTILMVAIAAGLNLGTLLPGTAGLVLILWALFAGRLPLNFSSGFGRNIKMFLLALFVVWAASFILVQAFILRHAFAPRAPETDWCLVLGAGLRDGRPSLNLQRRITAASDYLDRYPRARVVVTGGRDRNESITEAEGMRRALIEKGVAASRIYLEEKAASTLENLRYSREVILTAGGSLGGGVSVITSDFHLLRVRLLARRLDMKVHCVAAPTPWYLLPNTCLREYFALIKSLLVDW